MDLNEIKTATSIYESHIEAVLEQQDMLIPFEFDESKTHETIQVFNKLATTIVLFDNADVNLKRFAKLASSNLDAYLLKDLIKTLVQNIQLASLPFLFEMFSELIRSPDETIFKGLLDSSLEKYFLEMFSLLQKFNDPNLAQLFISKHFNSFTHEMIPGLVELIKTLGWDSLSECFASHSKYVTVTSVAFFSKLITVI